MKISGSTKISKILKENELAVEAIASINGHFSKLRNPLFRKVLAPRVTVSQAASIGKVPVNLMLEKLQSIGFEIEGLDELLETNEPEDDFMELAKGWELVELDVTGLLLKGKDPFQHIMQSIKKLHPNQALVLISNFKPLPLIELLKKKGFDTATIMEDVDCYKTIFVLKEEINGQALFFEETDDVFEDIVRDKKVVELNVKHLEMPGPFAAIVAALEKLLHNEVLYVHHFKVPVYLLPEISSKGFSYCIEEREEGDVKLLIYKKDGAAN